MTIDEHSCCVLSTARLKHIARKVAAAAAAVPEPAAAPPAPPATKYEPIPSLDPASKSRASKKAAKEPASSPTGLLDPLAKSAATTFGREITRILFGTAKRR